MVRTVISLDDDDKRWLDERAKREGVAMTELVRRAIALLRERDRRDDPSWTEILDRTRGLWKKGDGLKYQERLRREW